MIDMEEVLALADQGRYDELEKMGVTIAGDPAGDVTEGWLKAVFTGDKVHYFRKVSADELSKFGRVRRWLSACGVKAYSHDKAPMLLPGNYPRCQTCESKRRRMKRGIG
ncbi:hypothetical protein LF844_09640 [Metapseudomonas lalkuanensis]|uniref:hypothetical protein n=1 Tax=Metapseudomonas lalkuanensis TaxID=2604832 RepID=UPI001CF11CC6|nr:hypothetical protein [Pseudomonas lalkuanensis]UCP00051.1 hypothetical protein LF844_09640 [Pseudomonas lalkuanensis]